MAAQATVPSLLQDDYGAPVIWDTTVTLDRLIRAQNTWLAEHNRRRAWARDAGTALTTLTALALRGHSWTLAHVGDSRAWLIRDDPRGSDCQQLTQDHAFAGEPHTSRLSRAVGLDEHVQVDYLQGDLQVGDTLLLTSDGVHGPLARRRIGALCQAAGSAQARARYRRNPVPFSRHRPELPIWLDPVLARAVARDPKQRFKTAEELVPAPSAAKHTVSSSVVATSEADDRPTATSVAATAHNTTVSVLTPPQRSDTQPPATRTAAPMKAASIVSWPACTLVTPNWSW